MKAMMFSTRRFDEMSFNQANEGPRHEISFNSAQLGEATAPQAKGYPAVIATVADQLDDATLTILDSGGTKLIALRSKGFNNANLEAANRLGLRIVRVPSYSPYSVAEHVFALVLALVRHIPQTQIRTRNENFTIDGLVGFELHGKTFGVIGTGQIGLAVAGIARGFGCEVIAFDLKPDAAAQTSVPLSYMPLNELVAKADIISLHIPLMESTLHLIDAACMARMKKGVVIINTARGAIIDTVAMIAALKQGHIGGVALDVYELEDKVFSHDLSNAILSDDVLARLLTFNNVLITSHMGFLTREALKDIAATTLASLAAFEQQEALKHEVTQPHRKAIGHGSPT
jgi:D-lactate dehydrogenase